MIKHVITVKDVYFDCGRLCPAFVFVNWRGEQDWRLELRHDVAEATLFEKFSDDLNFFVESTREQFPSLKTCVVCLNTFLLPSPVSSVWAEREMEKDVTRK